ncbi:unnamed protein product (mitochondrion) [Plasmodiophora brassicae]|uniref:Roadblock/LAMTOR2 domain-containing protein n=1 Tax=Plasmodiophora brassicae TaxID=37360 RepID=A0A0G4IJP4_PLABS|nr:hypothetical protein PBRA_004066 [Plasmodiophora brassicae]SPQ96253.1 unnamed protein product [Plasmodiophora brassicae]
MAVLNESHSKGGAADMERDAEASAEEVGSGGTAGTADRASSADDGDGRSFVKWSVLQDALERSCVDGVQCCFLMKPDGSLLAFAGDRSSEKVVGGIVSLIWQCYDMDGREALASSQLRSVSIDCDAGKLVVAPVASFLFGMCTDQTTPAGLVRQQLTAFKTFLDDAFCQFPHPE